MVRVLFNNPANNDLGSSEDSPEQLLKSTPETSTEVSPPANAADTETYLWKTWNVCWQQSYQALKEYKQKYGNIDIPPNCTHPVVGPLNEWLARQRLLHQQKDLSMKCTEQLLNLGVDLGQKKSSNIPSPSVTRTQEQQQKSQNQQLSEEFKFSLSWNRSYQAVKAFKENQGHVEVPDGYKSEAGGGKVDEWIGRQRRLYRKNKLSDHLIKKLKELGINLDGKGKPYGFGEKETDETETSPQETVSKHNAKWQQRYQDLIRFKEEHGDTNVPLRHESKLGAWIHGIRRSYKKGTLDEGRAEQLKAIGFAFTAPKKDANTKVQFGMSWNRSYQAVKAFKKNQGHVEVPDGYKSEAGGGKVYVWIVRQRRLYRKNKLPDHLIKKLKELGINLDGKGKPYGFDNPVKWQEKYEEMKKYYTDNGNCDVPKAKNSRSSLGAWVSDQRELFAEGNLSEERIVLLNQIGFNFLHAEKSCKSADTFSLRCMELAAYKEQHGDFEVPKSYPANFALGRWLHNQRIAFQEKKLSEERIKQLADLGVNLGSMPLPKKKVKEDMKSRKKKPTNWMKRLEELREFKKKHGHCNVSRRSPLGGWATRQRMFYRKNRLQKERVDILNEMGFVFKFTEVNTTIWMTRIEELREFKKKHGHLNVSSRNSALGRWVRRQRKYHRDNLLQKDRVDTLNEIGFDFEPATDAVPWEANYEELKAFKEKHGHCNVPVHYKPSPKLYSWLCSQRSIHKNSKLSDERFDLLTQIGFNFEQRTRHGYANSTWETLFQNLVTYKEENGHCGVPAIHKPNPELAKWVSDQRVKYRQGTLAYEHVDRLDEIGFNFGAKGQYRPQGTKKEELEVEDRQVYLQKLWDSNFEELVKYKDQHGDCNIPISYEANPSLGAWAFSQKMANKKKKLTDDRFERLSELGFKF